MSYDFQDTSHYNFKTIPLLAPKNTRTKNWTEWQLLIEFLQEKGMLEDLVFLCTVGQKIKKSPGQKTSWNQIIQFHKIFFWPNSIFCNFKNGQKSIFELGKCKKFDLFDFTSFFACTFYFIFWPTVCRQHFDLDPAWMEASQT